MGQLGNKQLIILIFLMNWCHLWSFGYPSGSFALEDSWKVILEGKARGITKIPLCIIALLAFLQEWKVSIFTKFRQSGFMGKSFSWICNWNGTVWKRSFMVQKSFFWFSKNVSISRWYFKVNFHILMIHFLNIHYIQGRPKNHLKISKLNTLQENNGPKTKKWSLLVFMSGSRIMNTIWMYFTIQVTWIQVSSRMQSIFWVLKSRYRY